MGKKIQSVGDYVLRGVTLGKGKIARVELSFHKDINVKVALKIIDTAKLPEQVLISNEYTKEARILTQLRHPNIVRIYETLRAKTYYTMVLEYIPGGELRTFIKTFPDGRMSESTVRPFARQLLSAVHYLHERNVLHRNLNTSNVMVDACHKNVKIVDFGLCDIISPEQAPNTICGLLDFVAPEMMSGSKYSFEVDIWSLGVIMYNMLVGEVPFFTMPGSLANKKNRAQIAKRQLGPHHKRQMAHLGETCQSLLSGMLENAVPLRSTVADLENHAWVTEEGKKPFTVYQTVRYDSGMKRSVINTLVQDYGVESEQIESSLAEKRSNRYTTMYFLLLDEAKKEKGLHEVDHTVGPALSSPTSSSNLHNHNSNSLCRCSTQGNAPEPTKFTCTLDCLNFERSVSMCVDFSQSPSSPSQGSLSKQQWGSMRKSLQQGTKILNDYLQKHCEDVHRPLKHMASQNNGVQKQAAQGNPQADAHKDDLFTDRPFSISHNSLWQLTRHSPLLLSPDIQRRLKTLQHREATDGKFDGCNVNCAPELATFPDMAASNRRDECASSRQSMRHADVDWANLMKTSKTSYFEQSGCVATNTPHTPSRSLVIAPKAALDDIDETVLGQTPTPQSQLLPPTGIVFAQLLDSHNHVGGTA